MVHKVGGLQHFDAANIFGRICRSLVLDFIILALMITNFAGDSSGMSHLFLINGNIGI